MIACLCAHSSLSDPGCRERFDYRGLALRACGGKLKDVHNPPAVIPKMTIAPGVSGKALMCDWNHEGPHRS